MRPTVYATPEEAVADIPDGASVMVGGFAGAGVPYNLVGALMRLGRRDLTIIANSMTFPTPHETGKYVADLVLAGQVGRLVASFTTATHPSRAGASEELVRSGRMVAELLPQGTLAERIRAGGAGIPAFYTPAGAGTQVTEGMETREFNGRTYVLAEALTADYALVRAHRADDRGNLVYRRASRNYNPIMAMAATCTIVEVEQPIEPAGAIDPDHVHTPGHFVHRMTVLGPHHLFHIDRATRARARDAAPPAVQPAPSEASR